MNYKVHEGPWIAATPEAADGIMICGTFAEARTMAVKIVLADIETWRLKLAELRALRERTVLKEYHRREGAEFMAAALAAQEAFKDAAS